MKTSGNVFICPETNLVCILNNFEFILQGGQWESTHNGNFVVSSNGLEVVFQEDNSWIGWDEVRFVKTAKPWENGEHMIQVHVVSLSATYLARGIGLGIMIRSKNSDD